MKPKRNLFNQFFIIGVSAFMLTNTALAETILPSGLEIAQQVNARNEGASVSRNLIMEMVDRRGKKRVRETRGFRKYYGEEKRTMIFYLQPKNVRKTAFLTYDYPQADDDQWLYLPAMRKVRRISSSDRGDYFLGTDFTYEDIKKESKVGIEDYHWKTVGEETIDGHHSYVVEATPINDDVAQELGYSKVIYHVDNSIWMIRQSNHWDIRGNALKTINFRDIRLVQDIWSAHILEVNNHKTGHHTRFLFSDIDYATEVTDDIFTQQSLRRGL